MDNLILKIICTAIILVLFAYSCFDSGKDVNSNDAYQQPVTDPSPETPNQTHENSQYGSRVDIKSSTDNPANSSLYVDSNPE